MNICRGFELCVLILDLRLVTIVILALDLRLVILAIVILEYEPLYSAFGIDDTAEPLSN